MSRIDSNSSVLIHWLKFNLIGLIGVFVQLMLLKIFNGWFHLNYLLATFLAVELTVLHNFYWHQFWTWRDRRHSHSNESKQVLSRLLRFNLTNGLISIIGNLILMKLLVGWAHLPVQLANLISIGICSLFNFLVAEHYVFRGSNGNFEAGEMVVKSY